MDNEDTNDKGSPDVLIFLHPAGVTDIGNGVSAVIMATDWIDLGDGLGTRPCCQLRLVGEGLSQGTGWLGIGDSFEVGDERFSVKKIGVPADEPVVLYLNGRDG
jgi:hypothetical protein